MTKANLADKKFLEKLQQSPRKFTETTNPKATRAMKKFSGVMGEIYFWLKKEIGAWAALKILLKSWTWDMIFNKPAWQAEKFPIENEAEEKIWRDAFDKDVVFLLTLFRNLQKKYGEKKGDEIMARMLMPVGLQYQFCCFRPIQNFKHIDQARQQLADYLGDGKTMRNKVWVSQDGKEARYYYTKCMHIQMMSGYGMQRSAQASCMIDHVTFDKRILGLKFKRSKTLSLGDEYCDHVFEMKAKGDGENSAECYEDVKRCDFDAMKEVQKLEKRFDKYGPKLRK